MNAIIQEKSWYNNAKFVQQDKYVFALSNIMMGVPEMVGVVTYGMQRIGKTMYGMQVMYDIYRDWDKVLNLTFFKLEEMVSALRGQIKRDEKVDVIMWDDAGVFGSKYLFFSNKKLTEYLQNLFDVIGTAVKGIIITTPNPENLLKSIRGYEFYRVKIIKTGQTSRVAKGYQTVMLPSGKKIIKRAFNDHYNVTIPNDIFERYNKIRKSYMNIALDNLDEILKDKGEKDKKK